MTARADRYDSTDSTEAQDRIEPAPRKLPTEATDRAEPMEPTEATDPTEPMDRIDPFELMLRMESVERIDHRERRSGSAMAPFCPVRAGGPGRPAGGPGHGYLVMTAFPAASTTYHRPPALVSACPVALSGLRSGGQKYRGQPL